MNVKLNRRYSGYLEVPFDCIPTENTQFRIYFSTVITQIDQDNQTISIDMFNPLKLSQVIKQCKNFYLFIPEDSVTNCYEIINSKHKIHGKLISSFKEKRRAFRLPICNSDFTINGEKITLINISISGVLFIFSKPLEDFVLITHPDGKKLKIKIIDKTQKNEKFTYRAKILDANFNISQFLSEKYLHICKKLLKSSYKE